jgi:membrane carboxypeptidase/penicillin-binding protein
VPNSPNHWWFWIKKLAILVGIFLALSFIAGTIIMIKISGELPDPNKLSDRPIAQSTKIYDLFDYY